MGAGSARRQKGRRSTARRGSAPIRGTGIALLLLGFALLLALWLGPLVPLSAVSFSAHMILHLSIVSLAAPLIALGIALAWPNRLPPLFGLGAAIGASLFDMFVVWIWHAPVLHESAATTTAIFVLQQLSFLAAGLFVWTSALSGVTRRERAIGSLTLIGTFLHMTMLGVLLGVTPRLLYSPSVCIGAFGVSGLEDQWLGGVLMATVGGLPYLVAALVLAGLALSENAAGEQA
ncbi:MAG: cytochrome c oxidase assembly protein [Pseudomonadota bacterium]|nr:cytochrome c oxidase assembly protein [Pseudomonadota bacterium]